MLEEEDAEVVVEEVGYIVIGPKPHEAPLRSCELSWGATGLHAFLLIVAEGAEVSRQELLLSKKDGDFRLRQYIRELKDFGYLAEQVVKDRRTKRVRRRRLVFCSSGDAEKVERVVWEGNPRTRAEEHLAVKIGKMLPAAGYVRGGLRGSR